MFLLLYSCFVLLVIVFSSACDSAAAETSELPPVREL